MLEQPTGAGSSNAALRKQSPQDRLVAAQHWPADASLDCLNRIEGRQVCREEDDSVGPVNPPTAFRSDPDSYRRAWQSWRGQLDDSTAQPALDR